MTINKFDPTDVNTWTIACTPAEYDTLKTLLNSVGVSLCTSLSISTEGKYYIRNAYHEVVCLYGEVMDGIVKKVSDKWFSQYNKL